MEDPRLPLLLEQHDHAIGRLLARLAGPEADSGDGEPVPVEPLGDDELRWEPVPGCWSVRRRSDGPGPAASALVGAGPWGRDTAERPHPRPAPLTTIGWRIGHLVEGLELRADHLAGTHRRTRDDVVVHGDAAGATAALTAAAAAWRAALVACGDDLDAVGTSTFPYGSDPEVPLARTAWWVTQEVLHHGAEIALLRDLHLRRPG